MAVISGGGGGSGIWSLIDVGDAGDGYTQVVEALYVAAVGTLVRCTTTKKEVASVSVCFCTGIKIAAPGTTGLSTLVTI